MPTPFDSSQAPVLNNSFGGQIRLSFLPATSVTISFVMIMLNNFLNSKSLIESSDAGDDAGNDGEKEKDSSLHDLLLLSFFAVCSILFRVHAWVFLCSFLAEFSLGILLALLLLNILLIIFYSDRQDGVEPVSCGLYSIIIPTTHFQSLASDTPTAGRGMKRILVSLSLLATGLLLLLVWALYAAIHFKWFAYNPSVRIRRDSLGFHVTVLTITGLSALVSSVLLPSFDRLVGDGGSVAGFPGRLCHRHFGYK